MSLYNMLNGVNPRTIFLLPMIDNKHPDEYPRFRDVFSDTGEDEPKFDFPIILVYTRVGGGNRGCDFGEEEIMQNPLFVTTYDDDFDNTYGNYVFRVPEEFIQDFHKVNDKDLANLSPALQKRCREVFPKMESLFDELWKK